MDGLGRPQVLLRHPRPLLLSLIQSCAELRLSLGGKHDQATVTTVLVEVRKNTQEETGKFSVRYTFTAKDGNELRDLGGEYVTNRAEAENRKPGSKVGLTCLDSKPAINRVDGHRQRFWVVILAVLTAAAIGMRCMAVSQGLMPARTAMSLGSALLPAVVLLFAAGAACGEDSTSGIGAILADQRSDIRDTGIGIETDAQLHPFSGALRHAVRGKE
jgi:hypothetical protein